MTETEKLAIRKRNAARKGLLRNADGSVTTPFDDPVSDDVDVLLTEVERLLDDRPWDSSRFAAMFRAAVLSVPHPWRGRITQCRVSSAHRRDAFGVGNRVARKRFSSSELEIDGIPIVFDDAVELWTFRLHEGEGIFHYPKAPESELPK